jgi:glucokinase
MYRIGVDIGGTSIKIGLIDENLQIVSRTAIPFPHVEAAEVAARLAEAIRTLLADNGLSEQDLTAVGVVVPGSIDPTGEIVLDAHNLGFHNVPFKDLLQAQFADLPVYLANDADGAALGELGCGAFRGRKTAVLLTLGTGVGGGVILNGKMFSGGCGRGIELGHMQIVSGGELCTCGVRGCIEAYCSATALIRDGIRAMEADPASMLAVESGGDGSRVDAKFVIDCAKAGDPAAKSVFDAYVDHLAAACVSVVHLLDPEVIAIGGGVSHAGDFLFEPLRAKVLEKCFFSSCGEIVPAVLGNDAGMIGASMLE